MNSEIKRHIDSARQVLVGVVPNPTSQIDQITNALIYKFMDDMDRASVKAGGRASFFVGELERYAWSTLLSSRVGNQEKMNLYVEALAKFSESENLPELFRNIFKAAFLPYRSPEVLGLFLKEIDYFDYTHPEDLGDAYEYLLSIMSSQGDAGQFRTPRHIIDFIVEVVKPTKDDKILDPACGTAGFLISAYKQILSQHDGKDDSDKKEKPLTSDDRKKLVENFTGYDIDPSMVRIAQVNMYLHQFKNPKIYQYDTLSMEERWNDKFDVILANPPFMSPKGGVKPHTKFSMKSSRSEVLFVDYIVNHLRPNGRAGIIVPEGIIFQSGKSYKELRKNLVKDGLYAVVSLPSGVFAPYSGVKTSILLFNTELAKTATEILFVKIENDGFDLGAQRKASTKNDLPSALETLHKWNTGEEVENPNALYVKKSKIAENGDYNLSGDRYQVATDYTNAKWPMVKLGEVCEVYQPKTITSNEIKSTGKYKVFGANGVIGYFDEYNHEDSEVAVTCRGATCGTVNFTESRSWITGNAMVVKPKDSNLNKTFLFYLLRNTDFTTVITGAAQPQITGVSLKPLKVPLPPLEVQEQIVKELDGYAGIISGAKQIVKNWKPKIDIDPEWEKVKLGDLAKLVQRGKSPKYGESEIQIIKSGQARGYFDFDFTKKYYIDKNFNIDHRKLLIGDLLLNSTGVGTAGRITLFDLTGDFLVDGHITIIRLKKDVSDAKFVLYTLDSIYGFRGLEDMASGNGGQIELGLNVIKALEIPLPTLEIQKRVVAKIEVEREVVESAKKLIGIYEEKSKKTIAKLWEE